jgi:hypothetical protein
MLHPQSNKTSRVLFSRLFGSSAQFLPGGLVLLNSLKGGVPTRFAFHAQSFKGMRLHGFPCLQHREVLHNLKPIDSFTTTFAFGHN